MVMADTRSALLTAASDLYGDLISFGLYGGRL
jgi:hypothetical protein